MSSPSFFSPLTSYRDQDRASSLLRSLNDAFGDGADAVLVRVPGRVNLIGEHIDYCGYSVHPMAIEQDVLVAVRKTKEPGRIRLRNRDREQYPDFEETMAKEMAIKSGDSSWWNYFLCGVKGLLEDSKLAASSSTGMDCFVDGRVPPRAGLSSSSAVVVAGAMCAMWANDVDVERSYLADLCARSERFIGTQGGGMDQAIELLASEGAAKLIEFDPLRAQDVRLPGGVAFVVANSLAECNKAEGADYNARVAECRMATKMLAKHLKVDCGPDLLRLGDLQKRSGLSLEQVLEQVPLAMKEGEYTREEVASALGLSDEELASQCLKGNTSHLRGGFSLRRRATHVYSEASRVYKFRAACGREEHGDAALRELGRLMSESHRSCKEDYQCSHPDLDRLVELAERHGALGARLTGAGWGGCVVALVPSSAVDAFIEGLKRDYYSDLPAAKEVKDLSEVVFASKPGAGAAIFKE